MDGYGELRKKDDVRRYTGGLPVEAVAVGSEQRTVRGRGTQAGSGLSGRRKRTVSRDYIRYSAWLETPPALATPNRRPRTVAKEIDAQVEGDDNISVISCAAADVVGGYEGRGR